MRVRTKGGRDSLAGSLLVAHPVLRDPNFRRAVVLMTTDNEEGSMGMVLNRPLGKRLGEMGGDFALGPLASVPLFSGGPVQTGQLILVAWQNRPDGFQLHMGIDPEKAAGLLADGDAHLRAYFGYAGWGAGQLKKELEVHTWIIADAPADLFAQPGDNSLWRTILSAEGVEWRLLADEPDDPAEN
ncbi:MAG: YqgE/AlgH family protein [Opitutaceae bacterium]|jgi:putative transcriptional regulator